MSPLRSYFGAVAILLVLHSLRLMGAELSVGQEIGEISLPGLDGVEHSLAEARGRPAVLLFGELYNKNSIAALDEAVSALRGPTLEKEPARLYFVLGAKDPSEALAKDWRELKRGEEITVLHDRRRAGFERFGVKVLPTAAVVDGRGRLSLKVSGYPLNFPDLIADGVLFALGKIEKGQLDRDLQPGQTAGPDEGRLKAIRTARMGAALQRRKLLDLALARFEEARALDPALLEARLGAAEVELALGRVQEAEKAFAEALELAPGSVSGHMGLARIEIKRDQLEKAEKRLREQAALHPLNVELHYLLGEACERRGEKDAALAAYKRAASLALERSAGGNGLPGGQ